MSILFRASLLLAVFFGINKVVALVRQIIIGRQFGLGAEIDAFNVANNFPDLLVALISGGALALAFIPVLSEYIKKYGGEQTCRLFSRVANLVFTVTAIFSLLAAIAAPFLVSAEFGIAPGFNPSQQLLVVNLMRLSLLATLIFALSGLVTSYLQAHKQFLLPALSPILYNLGLIFGALVLAPIYGIYGLGIGVVIGATLHFLIQIPGLFIYKFRYYPAFDLKDPGLLKVLNLMIPRITTVLLIQISFLARDNLASRLPEGSVSALTYGYFIMQVPETLIGTAIATVLLPTLSELATEKKYQDFALVLNKTVKILAASTIFITVVLSICLTPLVELVFGLSGSQRDLLVWTSRAYLFGLLFQCLLEVVARAFYAKQDATTPLIATVARTIIFLVLAILTFRTLGAFGIAMADSVAIAAEVVMLIYCLLKFLPNILSSFLTTSLRIGAGLMLSVLAIYAVFTFTSFPDLVKAILSMLLATFVYLPFVRKEIKMLLRL